VELHVKFLVPEIILLVAACVVTLLGLARADSTRKMTQLIAALATALAFAASLGLFGNPIAVPQSTHVFFNSQYITILACAIGFLSVLSSWDMPARGEPGQTDSNYRGEFFGMMLFSLAGVAMIGKVNDLIWLFLVLELVSIPTYIMVATGRSQIIAQEAGVKYFFLGALAAAIFLFGFSYLYGFAGSTRFVDIAAAFTAASTSHTVPALALIGLLMAIIGISYKIAAVPLHFYAPDVYQGAATPVTAFLAFAPKAAGFVAIISIVSLTGFNYASSTGSVLQTLLTVMAILTMTLGNVLALLQRNIKRILAYSSIAHSGYMLVGLVAGKGTPDSPMSDGITATLFYLGGYAVMNLGAFAMLIYLQGKADAGEDLDDLAGVSKDHPAAALLFTLCLFSLIGMPATIGFLGKLYIVQSALASGHGTLAVIVVINAAIAAAYYLKIVAAMYLRDPLYPFVVRPQFPLKVAALVCTFAVIVLGIMPAPLLNVTNKAGLPSGPPAVHIDMPTPQPLVLGN